MYRILCYLIIFLLNLSYSYTSSIEDILKEIDKISKSSSGIVPCKFQEASRDDQINYCEIKEAACKKANYSDAAALYKSMIEELTANPQHKPLYKNTFTEYLSYIKSAAIKIKLVIDHENLNNCIFLGRSPFWIAEFLRNQYPAQQDKYISLAYSGHPGISYEGIEDDPYDSLHCISVKGFANYANYFVQKVGLPDKLSIIDSLASGRGLNSFIKIVNSIYKYNSKNNPEIIFIHMVINLVGSKIPNYGAWHYDEDHKHTKFIKSEVDEKKGIIPFNINTIRVKLPMEFMIFADCDSVQQSSCALPRYLSIDWEKPIEELIAKDNEFVLYQKLMIRYITDILLRQITQGMQRLTI